MGVMRRLGGTEVKLFSAGTGDTCRRMELSES